MRKIFDSWAAGGELPAIVNRLGLRLLSYAPDHVTLEMHVGPEHANPMGTLHGGVLCDLADAALGTAFASGLADGETMTTIDLKMNFFRPFWSGLIRAEGNVIRRGHTLGYVECELTDERGRVIAKSASTMMTLRGEKAEGR